MAKLIYSLDGAFLGEFALEKDRITIGRRPSNDIHIDNLAISGAHAAISHLGDEALLEDLDSTNGTLVNGKAIKKYVLHHGDLIELGKYQLKFVNEAAMQGRAAATPTDFEKTVFVQSATRQVVPQAEPVHAVEQFSPPQDQESRIQEARPAEVEPDPAPVPEPQFATLPSWARAPGLTSPVIPLSQIPLARIQVLNGPSAGKELSLSKALTTLGKPGVQVAVLTRRPHGYFVTHVEGLRHPVVNGQSVGAQAHQLNDHDVIEIAGVKMEFFFVDD